MAVIWFIIEQLHAGKPKIISFLTGAVAGLATITPASEYVSINSAAITDIIASIVCYFSVYVVRRYLDDASDIFGVHGMGEITGSILVGVFASTLWNIHWPAGLLESNPNLMIKQVTAVLFASVWSFIFTPVILWVINKLITVRVEQRFIGNHLDLGDNVYKNNVDTLSITR